MNEAIETASIRIAGANSDEIEAYQARPADGAANRGGVVLIHHLPGFDRWTKEVARRFAVDGYDVIAPNLFWRDAPGADPDDAAAAGRANGGVADDRLIGDVGGAVAALRALPTSNGKVAVLGHCSGGRQAVLSACHLDIDGAVDCYGAFVTGGTPEGYPVPMHGLEDQLAGISAPLLGLFGGDDSHPSPADVATLDGLLDDLGKEHHFHSYDGAGHAFFCTDRPAYRVEAALDGYRKIDAFFARVLG